MSLVSPLQILTTSCRGTPDTLWHDVSAELESQFSRVVVVYHSHNSISSLESSKHRRSHSRCCSLTAKAYWAPQAAETRSPDALSHRANAALIHLASAVTANRLAWCQATAPQMSSGMTSVLSSSRSSVEWWLSITHTIRSRVSTLPSTVGHTVAAVHRQQKHTGLHRLPRLYHPMHSRIVPMLRSHI
jgi:hypothetical protein